MYTFQQKYSFLVFCIMLKSIQKCQANLKVTRKPLDCRPSSMGFPKLQLFLYAECDPHLFQNQITSSFDHALPTLTRSTHSFWTFVNQKAKVI